jgi:AbrB family looped-hinge helix DNA binding protein
MQAVKILPKGQITIPRKIRQSLKIKEGDTLIIESAGDEIVLKKGKTIFDFARTLPGKGLSIEQMREKAIAAAVKDHD